MSRPARGAWIETAIGVIRHCRLRCRAPRGARGLKQDHVIATPLSVGRAPRGARGLKHRRLATVAIRRASSRPARGAWIETASRIRQLRERCCRRAPRGARGLKHVADRRCQCRVAPRAGAWIETSSASFPLAASRPARGAWIETSIGDSQIAVGRRAPRGARGLKHRGRGRSRTRWSRPARARGLKHEARVAPLPRRAPRGARGLKQLCGYKVCATSRPARGAWIETFAATWSEASRPPRARGLKPTIAGRSCDPLVAPRAGRVD